VVLQSHLSDLLLVPAQLTVLRCDRVAVGKEGSIEDQKPGMRQVAVAAVEKERDFKGGMGNRADTLAVVAAVLAVDLQVERALVEADVSLPRKLPSRQNTADLLRELVR
jgi:hypothetical protein